MTIKKTQFLKDLQDYIREGGRTITKLELWLVKSENYIRKLETRDTNQELILANETIKKLSDTIKEMKKDPHTALNKSEKKIESVLHRIVEAKNYQLGTYIQVIKLIDEWKDNGSVEQKNAHLKYKEKIENAQKYLSTQQGKYKELLMPKKSDRKPDTPWKEILGENYFD